MRPGHALIPAVLLGLLTLGGAGAPDVDEPEEQRPGLLARFSSPEDVPPVVERVVPDLAWNWGNGAPDPRVPAAGFLARCSGLILIQTPGTHRFLARTDGAVRLKVAGRVVLEGNAAAVRSSPVELPPGLVALDLEYRHVQGPARLAIDWEGPGFAREPLPARLLYHEPKGQAAEVDPFERGRRLADRYGCANCHQLLDLPRHPNLGPPLTDAGRAIAPEWLAAWLARAETPERGGRMPKFGRGFPSGEVADLVAFLKSVSPRTASAPPTNEIRMALNVADPTKGRLLFRSLGCLACHTSAGWSELGRKRTPERWTAYLAHPKAGRSPHRADFRLTADESAHLAAYLTGDPPPAPPALVLPEGDPARGRALAERARCASCHALPGLQTRPADLPLGASSRADGGCLASEPQAPLVPWFALSEPDRMALRAFVAGLPAHPSASSPETLAQDTLRRLNCLGCHTRDGSGGTDLGSQVAQLLAEDPALAGLKGTLTPPNLTAVGDKLRPDFLALAVQGAAPTARPWLSVRMPAFAFEPGEAAALVDFLQEHDRMGRAPDPPPSTTHPDARTLDTAGQLIGQRGFGCVSCHVLAGRIPPGGEPETLGPDLALAHRRMTARYFERWIANPQRIIAGTPMPQFLKPVATVPGTLDEQLATVWQLLGSTKVADVAAFGTRALLKREGDRALVVRDMILVPGAPETPYTPRGLAIGLKNDYSLLFDTDRLTWLAWWRGGFLSRTKSGRLWEWHIEGERLWTTTARVAPVVFLKPDNEVVPPRAVRDRFGRFDELDFEGSGVVLEYTLNGPDSSAVTVRERIRPVTNGWERQIQVSGVPPGYRAALAEALPPCNATIDATAAFHWQSGRTPITLRVVGTLGAPLGALPVTVLTMSSTSPGVFASRLELFVEP